MYAIRISGHYPSINELNVPRNATIEIYLDKEIDVNSIKNTNVIVTDNMYRPVQGSVWFKTSNAGTLEGVNNILTFTPETYFDPETAYYVTVAKYPDSIKATDDSFIQESLRFKFNTGISTITEEDPSDNQKLKLDLEKAICEENWCEVARISAILNALDEDGNSCDLLPTPTGIFPPVILPECLEVVHSQPEHMQSDIPLQDLRYVKLTFNDTMRCSGVEYGAYINVTSKNVLE